MIQSLEEAINRREALRRAALLIGGTISAPVIAGVLAGCDASVDVAATWTPRALNATQADMVTAIAERIIPETDTPGARGAEVHRFIDTMLAEFYTTPERDHFLDGLADVDTRAQRACGRAFVRCTAKDQHALLEQLDRETFASVAVAPATSNEASKQTERGGGGLAASASADTTKLRAGGRREALPPFFRTMKELTILGYYTSRDGATRELRHVQVPGRFDGCVPFQKIGRTWAV
jgi:glucoside 3-dehydrogenase (cytochrome c) hitch-hiker subunit